MTTKNLTTTAKALGFPVELIESKKPENIPLMIDSVPELKEKFEGVDLSNMEEVAHKLGKKYEPEKEEIVKKYFQNFVQETYSNYLMHQAYQHRYSPSKAYTLEELVKFPKLFKEGYSDSIFNYKIETSNKNASPIIVEAYHHRILEGSEEEPGLKSICAKLGLDTEEYFADLKNVIEKEDKTIIELIDSTKNLENKIYELCAENSEYKESLLKAVMKRFGYRFLERIMNFKESGTTYRNIRNKVLKNSLPSLYSSSLRTTIYEALDYKKPFKLEEGVQTGVKLPKWFTDSYKPLLNFIKDKELDDTFTTADLKECEGLEMKYVYKALNTAIDIGLIKKDGKQGRRNVYKVISKPRGFFKIQEDVQKLDSVINSMSQLFFSGLTEPLRDGLFDVKSDVKKVLDSYDDQYHNVNLQLFYKHFREILDIKDKSELNKGEYYVFVTEMAQITKPKLMAYLNENHKDFDYLQIFENYYAELAETFSIDLSKFNYNFDLFRAFREMDYEHTTVGPHSQRGVLTFNHAQEKISLIDDFVKNLGISLIKVQDHPVKGLSYYNQIVKKYIKDNYVL